MYPDMPLVRRMRARPDTQVLGTAGPHTSRVPGCAQRRDRTRVSLLVCRVLQVLWSIDPGVTRQAYLAIIIFTNSS